MSVLSGTCQELRQVLAKVEGHCQVALESIGEFNYHTGSYLLVRLSRKLAILGFWAIVLTKQLYDEHKGGGYVCVDRYIAEQPTRRAAESFIHEKLTSG